MKLRFKFILAFLLLSVVPLMGVIVYSFFNSQRAVRRALELQAQVMADEMGRRLEGVRNDLSRQMDKPLFCGLAQVQGISIPAREAVISSSTLSCQVGNWRYS